MSIAEDILNQLTRSGDLSEKDASKCLPMLTSTFEASESAERVIRTIGLDHYRGILIATGMRIVFVGSKPFGGHKVKDIPLASLVDMSYATGFVDGHIDLVVGQQEKIVLRFDYHEWRKVDTFLRFVAARKSGAGLDQAAENADAREAELRELRWKAYRWKIPLIASVLVAVSILVLLADRRNRNHSGEVHTASEAELIVPDWLLEDSRWQEWRSFVDIMHRNRDYSTSNLQRIRARLLLLNNSLSLGHEDRIREVMDQVSRGGHENLLRISLLRSLQSRVIFVIAAEKAVPLPVSLHRIAEIAAECGFTHRTFKAQSTDKWKFFDAWRGDELRSQAAGRYFTAKTDTRGQVMQLIVPLFRPGDIDYARVNHDSAYWLRTLRREVGNPPDHAVALLNSVEERFADKAFERLAAIVNLADQETGTSLVDIGELRVIFVWLPGAVLVGVCDPVSFDVIESMERMMLNLPL